ncbi:hypothetical protein DQ04_24961000 [Trypanosoma grayi]|uniref:hypothetical protein n=1 Tax=Trypanosoma grayi TaxID=71804 RepID=UPI0004F45898|nr:hypothetical protein DQ04_24961000 [Trypanosoma grayi]KEG05239.1 hypothetical protein DQ04_24961000 [Trypanosoma grayi]
MGCLRELSLIWAAEDAEEMCVNDDDDDDDDDSNNSNNNDNNDNDNNNNNNNNNSVVNSSGSDREVWLDASARPSALSIAVDDDYEDDVAATAVVTVNTENMNNDYFSHLVKSARGEITA